MNNDTMSAVQETAIEYPSHIKRGSLLIMLASMMVVSLDMTIMNIALPALSRDLQPSVEQLLWIVDSYSLMMAGLLVVMTALADRLGRKRILIIGYLLFGITSGTIIFTHSADGVILVRFLLGIGGAMIMPNTLTMIRVIFNKPKERTKALAIWSAVAALSSALGPIVGGVLLHFFSWHSAFLVNLPLMLIIAIGAYWVLPESKVKTDRPIDWIDALLSILAISLVMFAFKHFGQVRSLTDIGSWGTLLAGLVLMYLFVQRCLKNPEPLLDLRLFKSAPFNAGILTALITIFSTAAAFLLLTQWLLVILHKTPIYVGFILLPVTLVSAISSLFIVRIARKIGVRATLGFGLGIAAIGMLVIAFSPSNMGLTPVMLCLFLMATGLGTMTLASSLVMYEMPTDKAGNAAAIQSTAYDLGNVLGVSTLGAIASALFTASVIDTAQKLKLSLPQALLNKAADSVAAAMQLAQEHGLTQFAHDIAFNFTHALQLTFFIGGIVMLVLSGLITWLTPKKMNL